jgi:hypothetical protein
MLEAKKLHKSSFVVQLQSQQNEKERKKIVQQKRQQQSHETQNRSVVLFKLKEKSN